MILGLKWDKLRDTLSVPLSTEKADNTKRGIPAKIARIYDPLGVASPPHTTWKVILSCGLQP